MHQCSDASTFSSTLGILCFVFVVVHLIITILIGWSGLSLWFWYLFPSSLDVDQPFMCLLICVPFSEKCVFQYLCLFSAGSFVTELYEFFLLISYHICNSQIFSPFPWLAFLLFFIVVVCIYFFIWLHWVGCSLRDRPSSLWHVGFLVAACGVWFPD